MPEPCSLCHQIGCTFHCMMRQRDAALAALTEHQTRYPRGKLADDDEGELEARIFVKDGAVVINFGKAVVWFGMSPADARAIAKSLEGKATEAEQCH